MMMRSLFVLTALSASGAQASSACVKCEDTIGHVTLEGSVVPAVHPLREGGPGWSVNGATVSLSSFPSVLKHADVRGYFPAQDQGIADGESFSVRCPDNCEHKACEVIVAIYHCPPCSTATHGGLPTALTGDGWAAGHCAPRFAYPNAYPPQGSFPMVGFRKLVGAGNTEKLPDVVGTLSNVAIFVRTGAGSCSSFTDAQTCSAAGNDECKWENYECVCNWCHHAQGPYAPNGPTCSPCAPTAATPYP